MTMTKECSENYGTLAKMARRYNKVKNRHCYRSVDDHSREAILDCEEIDNTETKLKDLIGWDMAMDILDSWKYDTIWCFCSCFSKNQFGFRLGTASAFGFKKISFRVSRKEKGFYIETAESNSWELIGEDEPGESTIRLDFINRRQVKKASLTLTWLRSFTTTPWLTSR